VDLRTRTSLFCGVLALAIAVSILLRGRPRRLQFLFAALATDIGLWYLAQWLYHAVRADVWAQFTAILAVLLPQFALHLFEAIMPRPERRSPLLRVASVLLVPMIVLVLSPQHGHTWVRSIIFLYVFGLLLAGFWSMARRGEQSRSRAIQRRVRFLVLIGALAAAFSLADFLWFIGAPLPPVGAVFSIVFLFVLAESMIRRRLLDLYDTLGQLLLLTALAFVLAGIFYVFVVLFGGFDTMYLGAILAAIVILLLFEPLREKVGTYIHKAFFLERVDLERAVARARHELVHVLQLDEMMQVVGSALEQSRRATGAALYLLDRSGSDFELGFSFGPEVVSQIDGAKARPLIEYLSTTSSVALEQVSFEVSELRRSGLSLQAETKERLLAAAEVLGPHKESLCLAIHGEKEELVGILLLADDRVRDAFSPDEVALLETLAVQIGVVIQNSRQYEQMHERERLAALGQMAAGLAHEVKNPLGAIKGAAQLLSEPGEGRELGPAEREFLTIILEEVERLDRVVGSVLDYARPSRGDVGAVDLNAVVRRTLRVLASDRKDECDVSIELAQDLPPVRADAELLRQVLINLIRNAVEAMGGTGRVTVATRQRPVRHADPTTALGARGWAEVSVRDFGPGIPEQVMQNLFVPFYTTKAKGTGLGLAISQRTVQQMGGRIEVSSQPGGGFACQQRVRAGRFGRAATEQAPRCRSGTRVSGPTRSNMQR
jgi:two-component system sensor histidine kinase HydH